MSATKEDMILMSTIAKRAKAFADETGNKANITVLELVMDLDTCHTENIKLDLQGLSTASDVDVAHDVFGIRRHLNRQTRKMEHGFCPRYELQDPIESIPTPQELLDDPCTSFWVKDVIRVARTKDVVDVAGAFALLAKVFESEANYTLYGTRDGKRASKF